MRRAQVVVCAVAGIAGTVAVGLTEGAGARPRRARRTFDERDLVVTLVTPTLNQEVLPDLSDPGVNNVITVRFSTGLRTRDVIDNQNVFNRLTPKVEFSDSTFARLPGTPRVRGNVFTFDPRTPLNGGVLPQGQYTLNMKSSIRATSGSLLNFGLRDFTTAFSVGTDIYPPVLRIASPTESQKNIGLTQPIRLTFNEPIDPSSVISTIQVQDASTNPPTLIPGAGGGTGITLERNGFDVVFTPDPCFGYPPKTTIQVLVQGQNRAGTIPSAVTDVFGNDLRLDAGLQWEFDAATGVYRSPNGTYDYGTQANPNGTGIYRLQFETRGVKPLPQAIPPGSPMNTVFIPGNICAATFFLAPSCNATGPMFLYTTGTAIGQVDLRPFIARFNQGVTDFSLMTVVPNSPVRIGRPGGLIVDPRWDANQNFHTFLYVADQRSGTVQVVDSRNYKVLSRFGGFTTPRDVAIATDTAKARMTLYVSDFGANQLVGIDMNSYTVNFGGQPGAQSPCDAIRDNQNVRVFIPTGRGPTSVASDGYLLNRVMVCNSLDSTATLVDARTNQALKTMEVGGAPADVDWQMFGLGAIDLAFIGNQGGLTDSEGSLSMYIRSPPLAGSGFYTPQFAAAAQTRDGVEATFEDGIRNPTSVWSITQWISGNGNANPFSTFVANTGGRTGTILTINFTGVFAVAVTPTRVQDRDLGFNPTGFMLDGFYPGGFLFAAVAGEGRFAGMDPVRLTNPTYITVPGIRRIYTAFSH